MQFPVGAPLRKCVPLRPPRVGCTFRKAPQRETTSHSKGKFRDAFFESLPIRKARPTLDASGHGTIDLSGLPSIKRRPSGRRGTKFIASSARKEGHLMWPSSCAGLPEQQTNTISPAQRPPLPKNFKKVVDARVTTRLIYPLRDGPVAQLVRASG